MVDLKIKFSKYDYFGILIPGILFLIFITLLIPFEFLVSLNLFFSDLENLLYFLIFIMGLGLIVITYIFGLLLSSIGRWLIEDKIIINFLEYPSHNLFFQEESLKNESNEILKKSSGVKKKNQKIKKRNSAKKLFNKYRKPYSVSFINSFNNSFKDFFSENDYNEEDRFKLCFTIIKEKCPVTFSRMNTFIALYGLHRTLSITFIITFFIYLFYGLYIGNFLLILLIFSLPLLSLFFFSNYLKFLRAYSDEVFRTFYIYSIEKKIEGKEQ
ncbi:hypothetical protein LCGC14_1002160 [marine sediment metagenome]|uniref:Uncharacterized protein n=1 Tax=marine sediment metagenome TaxID=412755 RepID=A0A0F9N2T2_9ZZZZ